MLKNISGRRPTPNGVWVFFFFKWSALGWMTLSCTLRIDSADFPFFALMSEAFLHLRETLWFEPFRPLRGSGNVMSGSWVVWKITLLELVKDNCWFDAGVFFSGRNCNYLSKIEWFFFFFLKPFSNIFSELELKFEIGECVLKAFI